MAFGKKKDDAPGIDPEEAAAAESVPDEAGPDDPSSLVDALPPADDAAVAPEAAPAAAAPEPANSDALLSMFKETTSEVDDLAVLTDLAGDTDLDDILEELRTLRAALGITDAFEDDFAAAA